MLDFLQAITGVFVVVYDGQHALKFTLGRAKHVVGPGVHWKWPIVQRFQLADTRHTTLDLEPQVIQLSDDLVYEVDAKVLYQIVDLHKAIIEIDDVVQGLQNRVVLAIQRIVSTQTRETIRDVDAMIQAIRGELAIVEAQWGVKILQLGFSNLSPSPATLEITQLDLLARERLQLYGHLSASGLPGDAAVALVTGAVVTTHPERDVPGLREGRRALAAEAARIAAEAEAGSAKKVDRSDLQEGEDGSEDDEEGASDGAGASRS
ncbi:SPFH domain-containing protein [Engelhardtia mirabilis]|uniref:SPFH domain-containing protein n=1 Tax=Engelhardtia mirabilis TaxID=2528011 RepID=UPI0011A4AC32